MELERLIAGHVYLLTLVIVFLGSLGIPTPASVALLALGAAAHFGQFNLLWVLPSIWLAAALGDTLLYLGGRYTGWWLLAGSAASPPTPKTASSAPPTTSTAAAPRRCSSPSSSPASAPWPRPSPAASTCASAASSAGCAGVAIYITAWVLTGYLFSRFINADRSPGFTRRPRRPLGAPAARRRLRRQLVIFPSRRARSPDRAMSRRHLHERLQQLEPDKLVVIADVRSHGYYDPGMQRIKNSIRVEPTA